AHPRGSTSRCPNRQMEAAMSTHPRAFFAVRLAALSLCGVIVSGCGSLGDLTPPTLLPGADSWVAHWNHIAIDASGLDHTKPKPGENRVFGEQLGPTRASRAMAIVHIAIFDAVNAVGGGYESYTRTPPAPFGTSVKAAISQAAHDTLVAMYPSQAL